MAIVALLSNPHSTGNRSILPKVRCFCARNPDLFHYEVEEISQVKKALETIARVKPKILVVNGGDGTVQTVLTELYHGGHFEGTPPPVAVLPNGKTNLIALDLGSEGDPITALRRIVEVAKGDLAPYIVGRELIALSDGSEGARPVLGMFLGGAGLAETILYCRHKIYPLGFPNGFSHIIAFAAVLFSAVFRLRANFLPRRSAPIRISLFQRDELQGIFSILIVTTLERMLLRSKTVGSEKSGKLKLMAVDERPWTIFRAVLSAMFGNLASGKIRGIHIEHGDMIRIDSARSSVLLDGELFEASDLRPIVLRSTLPVPFLRLAT